MQLIVDTNILVRVVVGEARRHLSALLALGARVATTEHNVSELLSVLNRKFDLPPSVANIEAANLLQPFEVVGIDEYLGLESHARQRLTKKGQSDWPTLAAAIALRRPVWSGDIDFFGTGVAVWSTPNLRFVEAVPA